MALVRPTLKVSAAFGFPIFPVDPIWTDLSAYVLSCSGGGGKQHEEDRYEATQATILLDNAPFPNDPAGRFSPWSTLSPYYNLLSGPDALGLTTTGTWSALGAGSLTDQGIEVLAGTLAGSLTGSSGGATSFETAPYAISALTRYSVSVWVRAATVGEGLNIELLWFNGGTVLGGVTGATVTDSTSGWVQLTVSGISPSNANNVALILNDTASTTHTHYFTCAMLSRNPANVPIGWALGQTSPFTADVPIKVEEVYSSATSPRFFGYADSFKPVWVGPGFSNIELTCSDGLKQLSLFGLQTLAYEDAVTADVPYGWWRLGDAANTVFPVDSSGNGLFAQLMGTATFGVQGPLLFDTNTAVDLTAGSSPAIASGYVKLPGINVTGTWSFETWFKTTSTGTIATLHGVTAHDIVLVVGGPLNAVEMTGPGLSFGVAGGADVTDGNEHHVAVAVTGTGPYTVTLYVDGVSQGTTTTVSGNGAPFGYILLGGVLPFAPAFEGSFSDAITFSPASPAAHITQRAELGQYFAQPVSSDTRIGQVLALAGVDSSLQNLDAGIVGVQAETSPVTGDQALDYIGTCRDSEAGEFWQDPAGVFQFRNRYNPTTLTTPVIVFSDDDSVPGVYFNLGDPDIERDDLDLWTRIVISRTGGIDQTAGTGTRELSVSTLLETDIEALSLAQWKFVHNGVAIDRVQGLTVDLYSTDGGATPGGTYLADLLPLAFENRVTVRKKTVDGSQAFEQDSLVEYIGFAWTPTSLLFTLRFSAIPLVGGPWFTADVSAADGTDVLAG